MPRKKSGEFDQNAYIREYIRQNVLQKKLNFNVNNEQDMFIYEYLNNMKGEVNPYIKRLILEDIQKKSENSQNSSEKPVDI